MHFTDTIEKSLDSNFLSKKDILPFDLIRFF